MDVRAAEQRTLTTKRLEFDRTRPVKPKEHTVLDDRLIAREASDDTEEKKEREDSFEQTTETQDTETEETSSAGFDSKDGGDDSSSGGQILDVRV